MSCPHGQWHQCEICDEIDRAYTSRAETIEQLQAKVAELEADLEFQTNARIQDRKDAETNYKNWNAELKKQLAAAQEELRSRDDFISMLQETQKDQLAKAEQRVAEACAKVCEELDEEASWKEGRLASGHECAAAIREMKENSDA